MKSGISVSGLDTALGDPRSSVHSSASNEATKCSQLCFVIQNNNSHIFKCATIAERDQFVDVLLQFNTAQMSIKDSFYVLDKSQSIMVQEDKGGSFCLRSAMGPNQTKAEENFFNNDIGKSGASKQGSKSVLEKNGKDAGAVVAISENQYNIIKLMDKMKPMRNNVRRSITKLQDDELFDKMIE